MGSMWSSPKPVSATEQKPDPKPDLSNAPLLHTEWRTSGVDWSSPIEEIKKLKSVIETYSPARELLAGDARFPFVNVLLLGSVGSGKSSFFNTENSIFRGRLFNQAASGQAEHSLTSKFTKYKIVSKETKKPLAFRLCDTRGIEAEYVMSSNNIRYLLKGHIPDKFDIDTHVPICCHCPEFVKNPSLEKKMHAVVFVVDASVVDIIVDTMPEVIQNVKDMQKIMNELEIPQMVVLTKVDLVCRHTEENVGNVFRSQMVKQCVDKVADILGLPRNHVMPMKNYEKEGELHDDIDVLALFVLKEILNNCDAHLFNLYDELMEFAPSD